MGPNSKPAIDGPLVFAGEETRQPRGDLHPLKYKDDWKVLVVDDEELVKEVTGKMLISLGFDVAFASDGAIAIEMYQDKINKGSRYDLLIMDLTIPGGMGGKDAILKLREIDPDVLAIVSSGYANDPIMAHYRDYGFAAVLSKPFNIEDLSKTLSELQV